MAECDHKRQERDMERSERWLRFVPRFPEVAQNLTLGIYARCAGYTRTKHNQKNLLPLKTDPLRSKNMFDIVISSCCLLTESNR
jgi:hypothetical protein